MKTAPLARKLTVVLPDIVGAQEHSLPTLFFQKLGLVESQERHAQPSAPFTSSMAGRKQIVESCSTANIALFSGFSRFSHSAELGFWLLPC